MLVLNIEPGVPITIAKLFTISLEVLPSGQHKILIKDAGQLKLSDLGRDHDEDNSP